ncbi:MAG: polymerase subunit sigma [Clostridiales bacterium]|jgi:RNA polymerase sigma-70 factor (ECF subfamily)|nr:polymerase subunit sigma [Clostridiales bacterium]
MNFLSVPKENNSHEKSNIEKEIERMIDTYGQDVLRVSYMYLKDRQRAEDAFQEVFLKIYQKYESFRNQSNEKTWIIRIAINVCKDYLRSSWIKKILLIDKVTTEETTPGVDSEVIQLDENNYLFSQVLSLPPLFKEVIILYYYQEFDTIEISKILNIAEGTIRSRLHRARESLKNNIKERMDKDE